MRDKEFGNTLEGQRKLDSLARRLDGLPLEEEILSIDKDQSGKVIELRDEQLAAQWTYEGSYLKFSEASTEATKFETDSMDAAYEYTRVFLRGIKRRNAKRQISLVPSPTSQSLNVQSFQSGQVSDYGS